MDIIWFFLPGILVLGILTSYGDIKFGKIRNKWIIGGIGYAVLMHLFLIIFFSYQGSINMMYLIETMTNFLFAMGTGFLLWHLGIWTAGDGKLFIAFAILIPLSSYAIGYQKWFPSVTLLINIFVAALAILLILMVPKLKQVPAKRFAISLFQELVKPKKLVSSILYIFAMFWIIQLGLSLIGIGENTFLVFLLAIGLFSFIKNKLKDKAEKLLVVISVVRLLIDKSVYSYSFLVNFAFVLIVWVIIRGLISQSLSRIGHDLFTKNIAVSRLKEGMVLSESIKELKDLGSIKEDKKVDIMKARGKYYIKKPKELSEQDSFIKEEPEGLTKSQIKKIRETGFKKIKISQMLPFAPLIFLGVLITLALKGNILIYISILL